MLNKILLSGFLSVALAAQAWAEAGHAELPQGDSDEAHLENSVATHAGDLAAHGQEAAHASSGGLPQFDPTWFASQIFWLAITFGVLYFIFATKTLPEISGVIENRKNHIQADLEMAEKLTTEADGVYDAYQTGLSAAQEKAGRAIQHVEESMKVKSAQALESFRARSETEIKATEARISSAKVAAMDDMNGIAAQAAAQAVEKIIGVRADVHQAKAIVESLNGKKAKAA